MTDENPTEPQHDLPQPEATEPEAIEPEILQPEATEPEMAPPPPPGWVPGWVPAPEPARPTPAAASRRPSRNTVLVAGAGIAAGLLLGVAGTQLIDGHDGHDGPGRGVEQRPDGSQQGNSSGGAQDGQRGWDAGSGRQNSQTQGGSNSRSGGS